MLEFYAPAGRMNQSPQLCYNSPVMQTNPKTPPYRNRARTGAGLHDCAEREATIYKATCTATGKAYIGQTIQPFAKRRYAHEFRALRPRTEREGKTPFSRALRKHGPAAFRWDILTRVPAEWGNAAEAELIRRHKTIAPHGYNLREGGNVAPLPAEQRARLSAIMSALPPKSAETRARLSVAATGKSPSLKTRAKISESLVGNKRWAGRKHTAATKAKLSAIAKLRKGKRKTSAATKAKQSASARKCWTPARRAAQAKRMRARHRAKKRAAA